MHSRRDFLKTALLGSAALWLSPGALQARVADPSETFLNRLTFGATPADRTALATLGRQGWLDDQLARPAMAPDFAARLAGFRLRINYEAGDDGDGSWPALDEMRPLKWLDAAPRDALRLTDWDKAMAWEERVRPADEVIATSLIRAVHAPAQLREVMTQFWHDHFNVHAHANEYTAAHFARYDAGLRAHALGNFRLLLDHTAKAPAMLVYLNNEDSRASPANENYARELLELHTLGAGSYLNDLYSRWREVPKAPDGLATGYIDEDVYEVARAFTGWTIGDGRWVADEEYAPKTGEFHYEDRWHDPYQKRILGVEFAPNRGPLADGEQVLDILATHPGTARFVCTKIARRLLSDDPPPDLVTRLADVFLAHATSPDQIAQVIRALVADPAFDAPPTKLRRPFEFLAALYRATGAEVAPPEAGFHWQLARAGWQQHSYPPPTGHPDRTEDWANGTVIRRMVDWAVEAHAEWFGNTSTRLTMRPEKVTSTGELVAYWETRLTGSPRTGMGEALARFGLSPDDPLPGSEDELETLSTIAVAFAALSPEFMFR